MTSWVAEGAVLDPPAVLVHGTLSWGTVAFEHQRPLASHRRLVVPDRRGFGESPSLVGSSYTSDYEVDARDVVGLLGTGAHLVGHSYGGVVALIAASMRPDLVRSLALIEPAAHMVAIDEPPVAAAVQAMRTFMDGMRRRPVDEYLHMVFDNVTRPGPPALLRRAGETALGERPCWLAEIDVAPVSAASFPKLVLVGGEPRGDSTLPLVSSVVAARIGADLVTVAGAGHDVQREQPGRTNELMARLWLLP